MNGETEREMPIRQGCCGVGLFFIILFIILLTIVCSCTTTRYIPVKGDTQTEYISLLQKDSIYIKDSVYLREKGDTVFFEKWHTKFIERLRVDSFLKIDSISVPFEVIKEVKVERKLSWWQSLKLELGGICLGALILLIVYLGVKIFTTVRSSGWGALKTLFKI